MDTENKNLSLEGISTDINANVVAYRLPGVSPEARKIIESLPMEAIIGYVRQNKAVFIPVVEFTRAGTMESKEYNVTIYDWVPDDVTESGYTHAIKTRYDTIIPNVDKLLGELETVLQHQFGLTVTHMHHPTYGATLYTGMGDQRLMETETESSLGKTSYREAQYLALINSHVDWQSFRDATEYHPGRWFELFSLDMGSLKSDVHINHYKKYDDNGGTWEPSPDYKTVYVRETGPQELLNELYELVTGYGFETNVMWHERDREHNRFVASIQIRKPYDDATLSGLSIKSVRRDPVQSYREPSLAKKIVMRIPWDSVHKDVQGGLYNIPISINRYSRYTYMIYIRGHTGATKVPVNEITHGEIADEVRKEVAGYDYDVVVESHEYGWNIVVYPNLRMVQKAINLDWVDEELEQRGAGTAPVARIIIPSGRTRTLGIFIYSHLMGMTYYNVSHKLYSVRDAVIAIESEAQSQGYKTTSHQKSIDPMNHTQVLNINAVSKKDPDENAGTQSSLSLKSYRIERGFEFLQHIDWTRVRQEVNAGRMAYAARIETRSLEGQNDYVRLESMGGQTVYIPVSEPGAPTIEKIANIVRDTIEAQGLDSRIIEKDVPIMGGKRFTVTAHPTPEIVAGLADWNIAEIMVREYAIYTPFRVRDDVDRPWSSGIVSVSVRTQEGRKNVEMSADVRTPLETADALASETGRRGYDTRVVYDAEAEEPVYKVQAHPQGWEARGGETASASTSLSLESYRAEPRGDYTPEQIRWGLVRDNIESTGSSEVATLKVELTPQETSLMVLVHLVGDDTPIQHNPPVAEIPRFLIDEARKIQRAVREQGLVPSEDIRSNTITVKAYPPPRGFHPVRDARTWVYDSKLTYGAMMSVAYRWGMTQKILALIDWESIQQKLEGFIAQEKVTDVDVDVDVDAEQSVTVLMVRESKHQDEITLHFNPNVAHTTHTTHLPAGVVNFDDLRTGFESRAQVYGVPVEFEDTLKQEDGPVRVFTVRLRPNK